MAEGPPQFDWKKLWAPENRTKTVMGGVIVVLAIALAASLAPKSEPIAGTVPNPLSAMLGGSNPGTAAPGAQAALQGGMDGRDQPTHAYVQTSEAVPLHPINQGQCRTFAPEGWNIVDSNPNGTFFTLASNDRG